MESRKLLTKKAVAARLAVSERTIQRLVAEGKLVRPMKIGNQFRWFEEDVEAYLYLVSRGFFRRWPPKVPGQDRTGPAPNRTR